MMLFDCIISQLIVKGLSKTYLDFLSINEFFSKITPSLFTIKAVEPPLRVREDWWVFEKIPHYGKGRTGVVSDSSLQRAVAA